MASGLDARNPQQCAEGGQELVGIRDTAFHVLFLGAGVPQLGAQLFEAIAQARQRRPQIMGDIVGDLADAPHQSLDLIQHGIEIDGELIEVISGSGGGYSSGEVAAHDLAAGLVDLFDTPHRAAAHGDAAYQGQGDRDGQPPEQGADDQLLGGLELARIPAHQQVQTALQDEGSCPRVKDAPARARVLELEVEPAGLVWARRPAIRSGCPPTAR